MFGYAKLDQRRSEFARSLRHFSPSFPDIAVNDGQLLGKGSRSSIEKRNWRKRRIVGLALLQIRSISIVAAHGIIKSVVVKLHRFHYIKHHLDAPL